MKKFTEWLEVRESLGDVAAGAALLGVHAAKKGYELAKGAVGSAVDKAKWAMMSPEKKKRYQDERQKLITKLQSEPTSSNLDAMKDRANAKMADLRNRASGNVNH